jgi:hypothetical protein
LRMGKGKGKEGKDDEEKTTTCYHAEEDLPG